MRTRCKGRALALLNSEQGVLQGQIVMIWSRVIMPME